MELMRFKLNDEDKRRLLELARNTMTDFLSGRGKPEPIDLTDGMKQIAGAFVTLHLHGMLRGCIGEITPYRELYKAVIDHAVNAAVHDPRFPPVTLVDLGELDLEISALTPPVAISSYNEIELGRHGIVLEKNGHSAVFLPQVAPEQGWTLAETLTHLSLKAGLPLAAWREDCRFEVFEAIVFGQPAHD